MARLLLSPSSQRHGGHRSLHTLFAQGERVPPGKKEVWVAFEGYMSESPTRILLREDGGSRGGSEETGEKKRKGDSTGMSTGPGLPGISTGPLFGQCLSSCGTSVTHPRVFPEKRMRKCEKGLFCTHELEPALLKAPFIVGDEKRRRSSVRVQPNEGASGQPRAGDRIKVSEEREREREREGEREGEQIYNSEKQDYVSFTSQRATSHRAKPRRLTTRLGSKQVQDQVSTLPARHETPRPGHEPQPPLPSKSASVLYTILYNVHYTVPYAIPHSIHYAVLYTLPYTVPYAISYAISYAVLHSVPYILPYTVPYAILYVGPYSVPFTIIQTPPFTVPYTTNQCHTLCHYPTHYPMPYPTPYSTLYIVPYAISYAIPYAIPHSVLYTILYNVPYTVPYAIPYSIHYTVLYTLPYTVPYAISYAVPHSVPYTVPYAILYVGPYSVPYTIIKTPPFTVPYTIPNAIPYSCVPYIILYILPPNHETNSPQSAS
ncbi:hypothetical protein NFI96_001358 [Prochilodus magdalenae]|nr:hypothetical protein NFI96_001358 [Prochilodus magdalenae]